MILDYFLEIKLDFLDEEEGLEDEHIHARIEAPTIEHAIAILIAISEPALANPATTKPTSANPTSTKPTSVNPPTRAEPFSAIIDPKKVEN